MDGLGHIPGHRLDTQRPAPIMGLELNTMSETPQLSPNFSLAEMTRTDTGLANVPTEAATGELRRLCETALEPARVLLGPLRVNSGFRTLQVNTAIGGAKTSQHMAGQAADVVPLYFDLAQAFQAVKASAIPYDQLILEPTWIHISIAPIGRNPREQCLKAHKECGRMVYEDA